MYSARDVAFYIINWCNNNYIAITNLKLQKLLYFIQGGYLNYTGMRLIKDDFYAWQLGPVVPGVYSEFAIYSSSAIPSMTGNTQRINDNDIFWIEPILQKYARISTWELVNLSHSQDPWKYTYQIFGDKSVIPYESIYQFFREGSSC